MNYQLNYIKLFIQLIKSNVILVKLIDSSILYSLSSII